MKLNLSIMQLTDNFLPIIGGKQLVVHNLSKKLNSILKNNSVVVNNFSGQINHKLPYKVNFNPLSVWPIKGIGYYVYLAYNILNSRYNLIHAHRTYPAGYNAVKLGKLFRIPVVITPHGDDILTVKSINYGINLNSRIKKKSIYALNNASAVVAINNGIKNKIIEYGVNPKNVHCIPIGIDSRSFNKFKPSKNIIAVGRNHPIKDYITLLEAISIIVKKDVNVNCTIIGKDSHHLMDKVISLGISKNVKLMDEISPSIDNGIPRELLKVFSECGIYVSSSLSESFSLTILEAMSVGLPIVATNTIGAKELVINGKNGFIIPKNNPDIMANQILKLLRDKNLQKEFGKYSLFEAKKVKYTWHNIALKHINLYQELTKIRGY